jgi:hypothetical protein
MCASAHIIVFVLAILLINIVKVPFSCTVAQWLEQLKIFGQNL